MRQKVFKLDDKVINFYGQTDQTFREALDSGEMKMTVKNNLETNWKNEYYATKGLIVYRINGNQAKKYLKGNL